MFAEHPPRWRLSFCTRNEMEMTCALSGRMWSLKFPLNSMIWSKAREPVTRIRLSAMRADLAGDGLREILARRAQALGQGGDEEAVELHRGLVVGSEDLL